MGVISKTRRRVEALIAWLLAGAIVVLLGAGVFFVAVEVL